MVARADFEGQLALRSGASSSRRPSRSELVRLRDRCGSGWRRVVGCEQGGMAVVANVKIGVRLTSRRLSVAIGKDSVPRELWLLFESLSRVSGAHSETPKPDEPIRPSVPTSGEHHEADRRPRRRSRLERRGAGQNGPRIVSLAPNSKEGIVLGVLRDAGRVMSLAALAALAFSAELPSRGNSWVRNALRRLVRARLVEKVSSGKYRAA